MSIQTLNTSRIIKAIDNCDNTLNGTQKSETDGTIIALITGYGDLEQQINTELKMLKLLLSQGANFKNSGDWETGQGYQLLSQIKEVFSTLSKKLNELIHSSDPNDQKAAKSPEFVVLYAAFTSPLGGGSYPSLFDAANENSDDDLANDLASLNSGDNPEVNKLFSWIQDYINKY